MTVSPPQSIDSIQKLKNIKAFILDMDGTIYMGESLFPYTKPFLNALQNLEKDYCFFTNNSSKNSAKYVEKLLCMGIEVPRQKLLISNDVLIRWVKEKHPGASAYIVGTPDLIEDFAQNGIAMNKSNPDMVILGFDTTLTYEKLVKSCDFVRLGIPIYGVNMDWNCPMEDGKYIPDCGSIAALIKASTGVQCPFFGKPSRYALDYMLSATACKESELAVIGDRLYTDIAIAKDSAVTSILVLSGETKLDDLSSSDFQPDFVFQDLSKLTLALQKLYN